jgi:hypothetical protein
MQPVRADRVEEFYTVPELARRARTSPKRLRAEIRAGRLIAYTFASNRPRVAWGDFLAWLRSTRVAPGRHAEIRAAEIVERERQRGAPAS